MASSPESNEKLEKMIKDNISWSRPKWSFREGTLTDDDMIAIAYYLLEDNKVSN